MLNVKNISFKYKDELTINDVSFNAKLGEHISIIGESGSGKSTLLRMLYGEFDILNGEITWKKTPILGPKYNLIVGYDFMKFVTQEFDLMPYITVEENISKYLSRFYPKENQKRVAELIDVVELQEYSKTKVQYLSGGQKQRVALARALAKQPEILLLDEPFSHIDNFKKQSLRRSLFSYLRTQNITCIVATHDKEDALPFSDNIIVLHDGKIITNNTPQNLYKNPQTPLIASFFGEYSILTEQDLGLSNKKTYKIVYSHQFKIVNQSSLNVTVKESYFKGQYYLIEALFNNQKVFFNHKKAIAKNKTVYLIYKEN